MRLTDSQREQVINFTRELVRAKSMAGQERDAADVCERWMKQLGYDEVWLIDMAVWSDNARGAHRARRSTLTVTSTPCLQLTLTSGSMNHMVANFRMAAYGDAVRRT